MTLRSLFFILAIVTCGILGGCNSTEEDPAAPVVTISSTATVRGTLPDLAGNVSVMVGGIPAIITADTWTATLPLPTEQVPVVLSVDGEELRRVLINVQ
jgi:hypothetical protein